MAYNYARVAQSASRMIAKYGRPISILTSSSTPDDSTMPWRGSAAPHTEGSPTTATAVGAFLSTSPSDLGFIEANDDGLVKRGTKTVLVAPAGITPLGADITESHAIKDGTEVWEIIKIHTLQPGDTALLYAIEVTQ